MKKIPLSQGLSTTVDDVDFELLNQWKWYASWNEATKSFYAVRNDRSSGRHRQVRMHRFILGLEYGDERQGDHINGDTLDNRRETNLRISTRSENCSNQKKRRNNTSGYKGVYWHSTKKYWFAAIGFKRKLIHLGSFETPELCRDAYIEAAKKHHGEFANAG
jgi:hypothetical protein